MKNFLFYLGAGIFFLVLSLQFSSCSKGEKGCDCETSNTISGKLSVSSTHIEDHYSTPMEADGACHAKMSLKFRWADDDWAKGNTDRPPLSYEFQSLFSYFPTNLGMESTSISYDGKDITTWSISINEAVDKSNPEATNYGIYLKHIGDGGFRDSHEIICDVSISYKIYDENSYVQDCTH